MQRWLWSPQPASSGAALRGLCKRGHASLSTIRRAFHDARHGTANSGHVHALVVARLSAARALSPILPHAVGRLRHA